MNIPAFGTMGQDGSLEYVVDGWGSLITPGGTFNTLRVKTTTVMSDTIYINLLGFGLRIPSTETTYEWYASNEGFPVLTVTEQLGIISSINYLDDPTLSVNEVKSTLANRVYPNPVQNILNIDIEIPNAQYSIYTITGKQALNLEINTSKTIDVSGLNPGIYFLNIEVDSQSQMVKFVKN
jgi:hypothetical protein